GHHYTLSSPVLNIFSSSVGQQMFEDDMQTYLAYLAAVTIISDRTSGGVGLIVGNDYTWEYPLWRMLYKSQSTASVRMEHVCVPDNGSPRSIFQPETVLVIKRYRPRILICPNGVFEKEASFALGNPAPGSHISVYHRLPTGVVAPE